MEVIDKIRERSAELNKKVVFAESLDSRILRATAELADSRICKVALVGEEARIKKQAEKDDIALPDSIEYYSFPNCSRREELIDNLAGRMSHKGISKDEASNILEDPLYFTAGLVAIGEADAAVAGSQNATADVIRAAIRNIGLRENREVLSSTFLMVLRDGRVLTYADCGVVPYPDAVQLADIAIESSRTHELLTGQRPRVAMLSFSTKGSASHERSQLVVDALELVRKAEPDLIADGELQFDAAFVPEVAQRKAPDSPLEGNSNVFIFPNLDAGNIAYKITERIGGATATGPILQGLDKPMMDLSRGCGWRDIVNAACVAILMGEG